MWQFWSMEGLHFHTPKLLPRNHQWKTRLQNKRGQLEFWPICSTNYCEEQEEYPLEKMGSIQCSHTRAYLLVYVTHWMCKQIAHRFGWAICAQISRGEETEDTSSSRVLNYSPEATRTSTSWAGPAYEPPSRSSCLLPNELVYVFLKAT